MTKNQKNSDLNCKNKNKKIDFYILKIWQMKKEKFQEPTNEKTWLNRLEKFMTHSTFEFKTTDLLFRCHLEQRDFNSDWVERKCFIVEIYISKC